MKRTTTKIIMALVLSITFGLSIAGVANAATPEAIYNSTDKAAAYLISQQNADGSIPTFDDNGEWAAIALSAEGIKIADVNDKGTSLLQYFINNPIPVSSPTNRIYRLEQRILALHAAGYDSSAFNGMNYVQLLTDEYKNGNVTSNTSTYDDIFGIIAAQVTGDQTLISQAKATIGSLLALQQSDGGFCSDIICGWGSDTDSTAIALSALHVAESIDPDTKTQIDVVFNKAQTYIEGNRFGYQFGGWGSGNNSTSALVLMAYTTSSLSTDGLIDQLLLGQANNGGFFYSDGVSSDSYTTIFSILSLLGTNWSLYPAPISRPVAPVTAPVITPQPVTTTNTVTPASNTTVAPANDASAATEGSVEGVTDTTPSVSTVPTDTPQPQTVVPQDTTKKPDTSNTMRNIGVGLIATASLGLVTYGFIIWRRRLS